jgi:hypothetical protein
MHPLYTVKEGNGVETLDPRPDTINALRYGADAAYCILVTTCGGARWRRQKGSQSNSHPIQTQHENAAIKLTCITIVDSPNRRASYY